MLVLAAFLFCFSTTQGHAYPAPTFQKALVFSTHSAGVLTGTGFFARISGPSPEDVASFDVSGNGITKTMNSSMSIKNRGLFYWASDPGVVPNGDYVFTLTDTQGRSVSITKNFSYNGAVPQVDSTTMVPSNLAYVGTTTPTLSFSPVAGNYVYSIQIRDGGNTAIWYSPDPNTATSYTVPAGILLPNTVYRWYARVWDTTAQKNLQSTDPFYFYTGTKAAPEINGNNVLSFPYGPTDLLLFPRGRGLNVAPWDISYFRCVTPFPTTLDLARQRYQFNDPLYNSGAMVFPPGTQPMDGTYTFEIEDDLGRKASTTSSYTYAPIPDFIADTRLPADNAYFGTPPTFSWSRVQGDPGDGSYRYSIRITDYSTNMRWIDSPWSSDTTFTPSGTSGLPVGTSYKWRVNVIDPSGNNYRLSDYRTITFNEPEPTPVVTSVPTLSEWGMIILSILLAISAFVIIRRRSGSVF